ncbi:MAG TPA: cysteine protease, partial [Verrucomicrobiales bacterium]|nr:cysteine protease [Verrucomicrobiales bacterium]
AHGPNGDAEPNAAAVLYWFELKRTDAGVDFVPHLVDSDSGIGTQVMARDINDDGYPEIVVGNKKGTFVHRHLTQKVSRDEWLQAQPKALFK